MEADYRTCVVVIFTYSDVEETLRSKARLEEEGKKGTDITRNFYVMGTVLGALTYLML